MKELRHSLKYKLSVIIFCAVELFVIYYLVFVEMKDFLITFSAIFLFLGIIVYDLKLYSVFDKKLKEEMEKPDAEYVELKYMLEYQLWFCLLVFYFIAPLLPYLFKADFKKKEDILIIIGVSIPLLIAIINLIYKSLIKIVLDHDQITLYVAGRAKVSGNVHEINPEYSFRRQSTGIGVRGRPTSLGPTIYFGELSPENTEHNVIRYSEFMENSEVLGAYLKRRGLFKERGSRKRKKYE